MQSLIGLSLKVERA